MNSRITNLMQSVSETTTSPTTTDGSGKGSNVIADSQTAQNAAVLREGDLCAIFTRTTALLEQFLTKQDKKIDSKLLPHNLDSTMVSQPCAVSLTERVQEAISELRSSIDLVFGGNPVDEQPRKSGKAARAFEKLRRVAVKAADVPLAQKSEASEAARSLLVSSSEALENIPTIVSSAFWLYDVRIS